MAAARSTALRHKDLSLLARELRAVRLAHGMQLHKRVVLLPPRPPLVGRDTFGLTPFVERHIKWELYKVCTCFVLQLRDFPRRWS